jgi:dimethylamine--corrinoid protein Co-methyltransferase
MGGIKTAGDLVLRMQLMEGMKIDEAKRFVAEKLGVTPLELCDSTRMAELREERGFGVQMPSEGTPMGIAAKMRIAEALGIRIGSVEQFRKKAGLEGGTRI